MLGVDFNEHEKEETVSSATEMYQAKGTTGFVSAIEDAVKNECRSMNVENALIQEEMETFDDVETELELEKIQSELEFFKTKTEANNNIDVGVVDVGDGSSKLEESVMDIGGIMKKWNNVVVEYWGLWLLMLAVLWLVWKLVTCTGECK